MYVPPFVLRAGPYRLPNFCRQGNHFPLASGPDGREALCFRNCPLPASFRDQPPLLPGAPHAGQRGPGPAGKQGGEPPAGHSPYQPGFDPPRRDVFLLAAGGQLHGAEGVPGGAGYQRRAARAGDRRRHVPVYEPPSLAGPPFPAGGGGASSPQRRGPLPGLRAEGPFRMRHVDFVQLPGLPAL